MMSRGSDVSGIVSGGSVNVKNLLSREVVHGVGNKVRTIDAKNIHVGGNVDHKSNVCSDARPALDMKSIYNDVACFQSETCTIGGNLYSREIVHGVGNKVRTIDSKNIHVGGYVDHKSNVCSDARPEVTQTGDVKVYEDSLFKDAFRGVTWQSDLPQYEQHGKCYALIISNIFQDKKEFRPGGEKDVSDMENLFHFLKCKSSTKQNVKGADLQTTLDTFKKELVELKDECGSCIVIIMSHGGRSAHSIVMDDMQEKDLYKDFVYEFSHDRFPEFEGKPKIFLVQACQNYGVPTEDKGVQVNLTISSEKEAIQQKPTPGQDQDSQSNTVSAVFKDAVSIRDVLVSYATTPYHVAGRTGHGSFFIQAINEEFRKHAKKCTLRYMLHQVGENVLKRSRKYNEESVEPGEVERKEQNVECREILFKTYKFNFQ